MTDRSFTNSDAANNKGSSMPPADMPLGDRMRAVLEPALEDSRRHAVQSEILNTIFQNVSGQIQGLDRRLADFFNNVSRVADRNPADKNIFVIQQLTQEGGFSPVLRLGLPINTMFLDLSAQDIKDMPGYIALHKTARDLNVALKLMNVTADERGPTGMTQPAMLVIDLSRSYLDGAMENAHFYPDLPPAPAKFDRKTGGGFNF